MESSFLLERKIISTCFNPYRDSIFILSIESDKLELTEEDISKKIILRRFKLLKSNECNILDSNYRVLPKETYEGYSLYFWELARKIVVIYPFGYMLIYDYQTSNLNHHFQTHGRQVYLVRNIVGSPLEVKFLNFRGLYLYQQKRRETFTILI